MRWTLEELIEESARVLHGDEQPSGRVTDVPDVRTVRFYTSLGLVDGPRHFRGRKGLYGERQLLQLVAVKRLQKSGLALADVQRQLLGASDARLRTLSHAPAPPAAPTSHRASAPAQAATRSTSTHATPPAARFWRRPPAAVEPVRAFQLARGVTLLLEGAPRALDDGDRAALAELLFTRGLLPHEEEP